MPATPAWLASVEALLNRSIAPSLKATTVAQRLNGTALEIDIDGLLRIRAAVGADRLVLTTAPAPGTEVPADATLSGGPLALFELFTGGTTRTAGAARIAGDAEIANRYRELLTLARPDWEEELSRLIGDLPARHVARYTGALLTWMGQTGRTAGRNLAEYLQEESRDLVSRPEVEEFLSGVDRLRETADRVEARLVRLEQRLKDRT
jgi:ubiquinone biosynthesis protein UbiJ